MTTSSNACQCDRAARRQRISIGWGGTASASAIFTAASTTSHGLLVQAEHGQGLVPLRLASLPVLNIYLGVIIRITVDHPLKTERQQSWTLHNKPSRSRFDLR